MLRARVFKILYYFLNSFGNLMYILVFFFSFVIYSAYKNSMAVYLLLPELGPASEEVYNWIKVILALTFFSKLIAIVMVIFEQSYMDVYLVDFEKPNRETN
jgi:hypothetical protein